MKLINHSKYAWIKLSVSLLLLTSIPQHGLQAEDMPTFSNEVVRILQDMCQRCL